jgi:hypothetical protein
MKIKFILFFSFISLLNYGQSNNDSPLKEFSIKWKADSLANNGFRENHYSKSPDSTIWLINGLTFEGYSKENVIDLLGKPSNQGLGKEDRLLIMEYVVRKKTPEKTLILYFNKNNTLDFIIEETGMQ